MNHKKLSFILALSLVVPVLFGGLSNADTSLVAQNVSATTAPNFVDTTINATIHTRNLANLPIYDANGNVIKNQTAPANKDFVATAAHRQTSTGNLFFKVGDNQYLSSVEVSAGIPTVKINSLEAIVTTDNGGSVPLYDGNGNIIDGQSVGGNTSWYTNQQVINLNNGITYYQISTDRYISENNIASYSGV